MGRDLKKFLIELRDNNIAFDLNAYFGSADFADDYDEFEKDIKYESQLDVLAFLNDEFTDIDTDYYDSPDFEKRVFKTIDKAIKMPRQDTDKS